MQSILKGLRIVEGSAFIAAPSAGMTLAQLGADVNCFFYHHAQLGADVDAVTTSGTSPLHYAAYLGQLKVWP